jgi:hypothetical protein
METTASWRRAATSLGPAPATGRPGQRDLAAKAAAPGEREDITRWDFGDLPEQVEIKSGGRQVAAFPSLVEEAGGIRLRLLDSPALAREKHRRGVCRLVWQNFPDLLKQTEKDLAQRLKGAAMHYLMLDKSLSAEALTRDALFAAARGALALDAAEYPGGRPPSRARPRPPVRNCPTPPGRTARLAAECLEHGHRLGQFLAKPIPIQGSRRGYEGPVAGPDLSRLPGPATRPNAWSTCPATCAPWSGGWTSWPATRPGTPSTMRAMASLLAQVPGAAQTHGGSWRRHYGDGAFSLAPGGTAGSPCSPRS